MSDNFLSFQDFVNESKLWDELLEEGTSYSIYVLESNLSEAEAEGKDVFHLNNAVDATYMINMDKRKDRLKSFQEEAEKRNLKFKRIAGVDGEKLPMADVEPFLDKIGGVRRMKKFKGKDYKEAKARGRAGCNASHIKCIEEAKKAGYKNVCILEDDTHFTDKFNENFKAAWDAKPKNVDMFYFWMGGKNDKAIKKGEYEEKEHNEHLIQIKKGGFATVGYIANVNALHELYNSEDWKKSGLVIDIGIASFLHPKGNCYYMKNKSVKFKNDFSDIEKVVIS